MPFNCSAQQRLGYSPEVQTAFPTHQGNPFNRVLTFSSPRIQNLISIKYKNFTMYLFLQKSVKTLTDISFNPGIFSVILISLIYVKYLICIFFFYPTQINKVSMEPAAPGSFDRFYPVIAFRVAIYLSPEPHNVVNGCAITVSRVSASVSVCSGVLESLPV